MNLAPPPPGWPFAITVTAMDPYGNIATGYGGTIKLSSSDPAAAIPRDVQRQRPRGRWSPRHTPSPPSSRGRAPST